MKNKNKYQVTDSHGQKRPWTNQRQSCRAISQTTAWHHESWHQPLKLNTPLNPRFALFSETSSRTQRRKQSVLAVLTLVRPVFWPETHYIGAWHHNQHSHTHFLVSLDKLDSHTSTDLHHAGTLHIVVYLQCCIPHHKVYWIVLYSVYKLICFLYKKKKLLNNCKSRKIVYQDIYMGSKITLCLFSENI